MSGPRPNVHVVDHPLMRHHLTHLRSCETTPIQFRAHVRRLASLLAYEATQDLEEKPHEIQTPLTTMTGSVVSSTIGLIPILRAGLGMVEPVLDLLPDAQVWHLGLYRNEETAQPVHYYSKLPPGQPVDVALILDPMLATGGSAIAALDTLTRWGVPRIKLVSIIAAQAGIEAVSEVYPQTDIHVCAVDPELNASKFIVPGLGDAGDRTFNTVG
ncbi:MAG: uracil phosphoribosyltransferase [Planctomycetaceae bacterium]|nr:uracil phosphoribosyltransferase [Planctomycetaceae bacterium]